MSMYFSLESLTSEKLCLKNRRKPEPADKFEVMLPFSVSPMVLPLLA
ncbi:MAG: hypothetical protein GX684_01680 [Ruminococcaceae bacterium]|nr:hypothetical protein [Oscillospiraceae bacterium]